MPQEIVIVGAGVIGLTIAYQLADDNNLKVKVVSKCLPVDAHEDYTSQYAGANWRSVCANNDYQMISYEQATLQYFRQLSESHPELVNKCMSYDVFDPREPDVNDQRKIRPTDVSNGELPWFQRIAPEFKVMDASNLPQGAQFGIAFDTVTINAPAYVRWLYEECLKKAVEFEIRQITRFADIKDQSTIIINCTGLGAIELCKDHSVYPTRGQTVLVKNTTNLKDTYSRVGQDHLSYLIPRPGDGGLIIGGCQQPHKWTYEVDVDLAAQMLTWAQTLYPGVFPADHEFEIIKHNVGLRPSRVGGPRVETESIDGRTIIHGYGIGGWGFQSSWGIGLRLTALLQDTLRISGDKDSIVFDEASAKLKVKKAQALWNTRDALTVAKAYTEESNWRNRDVFLHGRAEIEVFLQAKWEREHNYRLRKELFSFQENRIAVEFYYEYSATPSESSQWFRCYGIEHWVFASDGRMRSRQMSGNEIKIARDQRWFVTDEIDEVVLPRGHMSF